MSYQFAILKDSREGKDKEQPSGVHTIASDARLNMATPIQGTQNQRCVIPSWGVPLSATAKQPHTVEMNYCGSQTVGYTTPMSPILYQPVATAGTSSTIIPQHDQTEEQRRYPARNIIKVPNRYPDRIYVAFLGHWTGQQATCAEVSLQCWLKMVTPRNEHCQLVFEWGDGYIEPIISATFSTTKTGPSTFVNPAYKDEKWYCLRIDSLSDKPNDNQANRQRRHLLFEWTLKNQYKPFNYFGYYCNFLPHSLLFPCLSYNADGDSYYCAEQVATALQNVKVSTFIDVVPYRCVPDTIEDLLMLDGAKETFLAKPSLGYVAAPESQHSDEDTNGSSAHYASASSNVPENSTSGTKPPQQMVMAYVFNNVPNTKTQSQYTSSEKT